MRGVRYCAPAALLMIMGAGCDTARPDRRTFSFIRITNCSPAQAYQAARTAMADRHGIDQADPVARVLVSAPQELDRLPQGIQVGDAVGLPRRVRATVKTQVTGSESVSEVWCQVNLENYESNDRALYNQEHAITDLPTDTPAERGAATTEKQNAIWQPAGRDRRAERDLLNAVREIAQEMTGPESFVR